MSIEYNVFVGVGFMLDGAKVVEAMSQSDAMWDEWEEREELTFLNNFDYAADKAFLGIIEGCLDFNEPSPFIPIEEESPSMFKDMLERNTCDKAFNKLFGRCPTDEEAKTYGKYVFATVS